MKIISFKYTALILVAVSFILVTYSIGINYYINNYDVSKNFFSDCTQVWGHRGHTKDYHENTPESWNHAIDLGATGVEMDVFYDNNLNQFIVSHHKPYFRYKKQLLTLESALKSLSKPVYVWIDLKELHHMKNLPHAITLLHKILVDNNRLEKTIIESQEGMLLRKMANKGLHTSYWTNFAENQMSYFRYFAKDLLRKSIIAFSDFTALSMPYYRFQPNSQSDYKNFPIMLFTVNDKSHIKKYDGIENVKVILTDENYFKFLPCK